MTLMQTFAGWLRENGQRVLFTVAAVSSALILAAVVVVGWQVRQDQRATERYIHDTICALYSQAHRPCPVPPVQP